MAIKELFYDQRPVALLNPRASQRIDPRFTFTRASTATYIDENQNVVTAELNQPRFSKPTPNATSSDGLLVEPARTNLLLNSEIYTSGWSLGNGTTAQSNVEQSPNPGELADKLVSANTSAFFFAQQNVTISTGAVYTHSFYAKAAGFNYARAFTSEAGINVYFYLQGAGSYSGSASGGTPTITALPNGWYYCTVPFVSLSATNYFARCYITDNNTGAAPAGDGVKGIYLWGSQVELGANSTSYISTTSTAVTRAADLLSVNSLSIPSTGSVYIDARAIGAAETDTLISLKNASNEKINLSYESNAATYNSLALIASYKGTSKSSLPLPVPTTARERNIITWGANNYQYTTDSARYATSLSSSVPANLTQLSIGHDAVDPTKAFNGYINAVYLYNGEITPVVAEVLVRGELDLINADTYSPVGPAGSLALVINTQGASASGDKTFTLPAESALNDNDIVITWGDGTESGLDGASAELGASGLTHTYPAAGIYPVWVEGQLENLQFNNIANAPDLVQIAAWGTSANSNDVFRSPSTMASAFYGCSQMDFSSTARTTNLPDTSAVTNWYRAFRGCSSITGTFPAFNFSAATTLQEAWQGCSGLTSFTAAGDQTQNVTNFSAAWYDCSSLTNFPQINTAAGTSFGSTWQGCSSLTSFPEINTGAGTNFSAAWYGCSSLTSFPQINTANGTDFRFAWGDCTSLTSFPGINTAAGTDFSAAWRNCTSLTSFPGINTAAGTSFDSAWRNCTSLTSFPGIDTAAGTNFSAAWYDCSSLTSFPQINTAAGTNFGSAWQGCSSLTSFPQIDTAAGTNFSAAWYGCSSLTSFPGINTAAGTDFRYAWGDCTGLTNFPQINTATGTDFRYAWRNCTGLTSFPQINTANGTNFSAAWQGCSSLTAFPALNFDSATGSASDAGDTGFRDTWRNCTSLTDFPANRFNTTTCTRYLDAWTGCALTAQSIENILVSINTANTSNGNLGIGGGTNAAKTTWSTAANNAYDALVARGWTITYNA